MQVTLTTKAITTVGRDCTPSEHTVSLVSRDLGVVLRIDDTPGQWYLSTLLGIGEGYSHRKPLEVPGEMSIDFGQGWVCTNMRAIIADALAHILRTWV